MLRDAEGKEQDGQELQRYRWDGVDWWVTGR